MRPPYASTLTGGQAVEGLASHFPRSSKMAKSTKTPDKSPMGRFALIKARIKSIFNGIRLARIVLRHLEACLSEIFALSGEEITSELAPTVELVDPTESEPAREVSLG